MPVEVIKALPAAEPDAAELAEVPELAVGDMAELIRCLVPNPSAQFIGKCRTDLSKTHTKVHIAPRDGGACRAG
jgi:hypothetical protein